VDSKLLLLVKYAVRLTSRQSPEYGRRYCHNTIQPYHNVCQSTPYCSTQSGSGKSYVFGKLGFKKCL